MMLSVVMLMIIVAATMFFGAALMLSFIECKTLLQRSAVVLLL